MSTDYGHTMEKSLMLCIPNSDPNPKYGQGIHRTKMGADKLAKNTPNAPKFICTFTNEVSFMPRPKYDLKYKLY
jgi:hypothetical protein